MREARLPDAGPTHWYMNLGCVVAVFLAHMELLETNLSSFFAKMLRFVYSILVRSLTSKVTEAEVASRFFLQDSPQMILLQDSPLRDSPLQGSPRLALLGNQLLHVLPRTATHNQSKSISYC